MGLQRPVRLCFSPSLLLITEGRHHQVPGAALQTQASPAAAAEGHMGAAPGAQAATMQQGQPGAWTLSYGCHACQAPASSTPAPSASR